jgi:hypothetical protein
LVESGEEEQDDCGEHGKKQNCAPAQGECLQVQMKVVFEDDDAQTED